MPSRDCPYQSYVTRRRKVWRNYRNGSFVGFLLAIGWTLLVILVLEQDLFSYSSGISVLLASAAGFFFRHWHRMEHFYRHVFEACVDLARTPNDRDRLDQRVEQALSG